MIRVIVSKQSKYPIRTPRIKRKIKDFLEKGGIVSDCFIYIFLVNEARIKEIAAKYLNEKNVVHDVLSFPENETKGKFIYPDKSIRLGEIYICYSKVVEDAKKENILIDDRIDFLIEHAIMHLLGEHHS